MKSTNYDIMVIAAKNYYVYNRSRMIAAAKAEYERQQEAKVRMIAAAKAEYERQQARHSSLVSFFQGYFTRVGKKADTEYQSKEERLHEEAIDRFVRKLRHPERRAFNVAYDNLMDGVSAAYKLMPERVLEINRVPRMLTFILGMRTGMDYDAFSVHKLQHAVDIFLHSAVEVLKGLPHEVYVKTNEECYELAKLITSGLDQYRYKLA